MSNPLLNFDGLPRFDEIRPEHVTPAIETLLNRCKTVVAGLEAPMTDITWDNFVTPLDDCTEQLSRAWGIVGHLSAVVDTPELRAAYNENIPRITEFWTSLSQNLALFKKYKTLRNASSFDSLSPSRQRVIENTLRDFRLGGAELPEDKKKRFAEIQEKTASLSTRFSENVLDATNDFELFIKNVSELSGLPEDILHAAQAAARADNKTGYKFTLHFPSFYPVMQYADNRAIREKMYRANATRASELGTNPEWDNTGNINELLRLRKEEALLLGYPNFAEVSLVPKMARTPDEVIAFLEDLAERARPYAEKDLAELKRFGKDELGIDDLQAWDMAYVSEKLRQKRYAFSEQEVRQYFPEPNVLEGLFRLVQTLYSVSILPDTAPVWHKDVKFFRIEKAGKLIGQFYMDLYARPGKRGGAWMDDARSRRMTANGLQTPVAYLTCNFSSPLEKDGKRQPALFTHDEVMTLYHEFGHGLHHLLTKVDELGVSGISGVEWDAVEMPSQFMENFCWEWDVVRHMTSHIDTKEPLPKELFDKMLAAKNYQSGLQMLRQVEFSLADMHLHYDYDPDGQKTAQNVLDEIRQKYAVVIPPAFNRFLQSFSHIFAGGYAAGYYSYKWAEVLSADVYSAFEESLADGNDLVSPAMGARLLEEILSVGGSRPAIESFTAFRGRQPTIDALLRHNGLAA
ncbi:M3 family metallopeptidase [Oxalobacter aliiformigenes]|uniref:oligopeptidase A n=1 Tax=Oxalobacter aliiformigenes TaxID=2946593 RepID=A0ABY7JIK9_9BURK|nr:M3 family metallopeptidase [Oxalobacter aliiformigenes]WAV93724.1 M3 family metallopeptidase [Oxalobacter aliiformigenes]WAV94771.1 M3 family metallopeptidase [Oxalobacter aliiformigenes]WAV97419.1 M3 family metallopeptidase [Oxalobacter aliiformigenes]